MFNVEFNNKNGEWAFRTFRTQAAADVFAKNVELQGGTVSVSYTHLTLPTKQAV